MNNDLNNSKNLKNIKIIKNKNIIYIINNNKNHKNLMINLNSNEILITENISYFSLKRYEFSEFIGIFDKKNSYYLILVNKCIKYLNYGGKNNTIYKIHDIVLLDIKKFVINEELSNTFTEYYKNDSYFSIDYNLVNTFNNNKDNILKNNWIFIQNLNFLEKLIILNLKDWIIPVIYGKFITIPFNDNKTQSKKKIVMKILFNSFYNIDNNTKENNHLNIFGFKSDLILIEILVEINDTFHSKNIILSSIPKKNRNFNFDELKNYNFNDDYILENNLWYSFLKFIKFKFNINDVYFVDDRNKNNCIDNYYLKVLNYLIIYSKNKNIKKIDTKNNFKITNDLKNMLKTNNDFAFLCSNIKDFFEKKLLLFSVLYLNHTNKIINNYSLFDSISESLEYTEILKNKLKNKIDYLLNNMIKYNNKLYNFNNHENKDNLFNNLNFERKLQNYNKKNKIDLFINNNINLTCVSFNLSGFNFSNEEEFLPLIDNLDLNKLDILFFGFQEIIELKSQNWGKIIKENLKEEINNIIKNLNIFLEKFNFRLIIFENLVGLLSLLYIKTTTYFNLRIISINVEKMGFMKTIGNKGFININLELGNKKISFNNCHLNSGINLKDVKKREEQVNFIIKYILKLKNNYDIILGDFNFRTRNNFKDNKILLNNYYEENEDLKKKEIIKKLLNFDELKFLDIKGNFLKENLIEFLPTYKYKEKEIFLKKESQSASYCDRIFHINNNESIKNEFKINNYYSFQNINISDHK